MHAEKTPVRFRHPLQIMGTVPTSVGASCAFLLRIVSTRTDVVDEAICRGLVVGTPTLEQEQHCIAALHKERFPNDQKPIIMHIVDAHIAVFLPVPLQQLFPLWRFIPSKLMGRGFPAALFFLPPLLWRKGRAGFGLHG